VIIMVMVTGISIVLALFIDAIIRQSHERQQLIEELQAARQDLAAAERQAGVQEERQRLARDIHDTLAQGFISIVIHLEALEQALPTDSPVVQRHLDQARRTARESLAEARSLVWALRPELLDHSSLAEALPQLAARWSDETGVPAMAAVTGAPQPLAPQIEVTLLRAAQEALANIRKHARARQVALTLSYMGDSVVLDIQDDGVGFALGRLTPADQVDIGYGLVAMRERVEQMGGTLTLESAPGEGTTLAIELPV
jgi:signal transduction histidine kinase